MREDNEKDSIPEVYESRPPVWLPKTHTSADLGFSGFHPPRPGQDEDVLSEASVKNGFVIAQSIPAETFSAQDTIHTRFIAGDALTELDDLMNQVFARRAEQVPPIPASSFRMPSRVTLNDAKRHAWFADLANPDVPLYKLGKSVPHGAKGHDLLDLLHANKVAIPRAVWFLRVFGANETAGLRNKPSYNPTQYSVEWANVVTSYMKKQLADIALPSAPRPGLNIKQTFKGVLVDADSRDRWISRFTYCLQLLRTFYSEGLVDNTTFLTWLVQQLGTCNLAQAGFLTRLADQYLDGMLGCRALTRPFIDACLAKLSEIRTTTAQEFLLDTQSLLEVILQRVCLAFPDVFISPRTWTVYSSLLREVLTRNSFDRGVDQRIEQNFRDVQQTLLDDFSDLKRRNEAMLFYNLPTQVMARLGSAVSDIQLLNSISSNTDLDTIAFFDLVKDYSSEFVEKLDLLLTWSVTPLQYGDHRPYASVALLRNWRDRAMKRATRRDCTPPDEFIQDKLFDWLDSSDVAGEPNNIRAVALLLENLVQDELFSYVNYIQRLIARGEPGLSFCEENASRHRMFLRWIPLHKSTSSLISQRKMILHGARARETPECLIEREIRKEIRAILPELFGGHMRSPFMSSKALLAECSTLVESARFEQVRTFRQWLMPILRKSFTNQVQETLTQPTLLRSYSMSVEIMALARCFDSILDLSLLVLEHSTTTDLLSIVVETIQRHLIIWTCKNATGTITTALYSAHQFWRTRGLQCRGLLALLVAVDNGRYLDTASREQVEADISSFTHALQPETDNPDSVPAVLPEILLLADDPNPEASTILANSLWYKYRSAHDWAWKVWDNTVASLRQIPVLTADINGRRTCALRYGSFLLHVDQHLPNGFDDQVLQWFLGPGKGEVAALNSDAWDVLTVVILYLSIHGALKTTTVLRGLVYPAWQLAASASSGHQGQSLGVFLYSANVLFELLLIREDSSGDNMPPADLLEFQRIRTWRQDVYREPHFSLLVGSIPTLVFIENNEYLSENLRHASMSLRLSLCGIQGFCQGAYRNIDAVRHAFEQPLQSDGTCDNLREPLVDALRLVLCESHKKIPSDLSSLLSPWKLGATAIILQFVLKQMGKDLSQDATHQASSVHLDELTLTIFRHSMTSEEAFFVAEIARGVGSEVAGKFVNNGIRCITGILDNLDDIRQIDSLSEGIRRAGEILRTLTHLTEPLRAEVSLLPPLESDIQDEFFNAICNKFREVESMLSTNDNSNSVEKGGHSHVTLAVIFLGRLLQFDIGFRGAWTATTKTASTQLVSTIFYLAVIYGAGDNLDLIAFPLLVDTLYYLLDEIPCDAKNATFDPFRNYPQASISELPLDMPSEYRSQLQFLLPHALPNATVMNLTNAYRDSTGTLVHGSPVLNRPWEWVENLGEPASLDQKEEEKEREEKERLRTRYLVKNSGSLSLETFSARVTGDGVIGLYKDAREEGNVRSFEDGLSSESVFKRDWRETRVSFEGAALLNQAHLKGEEDGGGGATLLGQTRAEKRPAPKVSPASSVLSRTPASGSNISLRPSPGQPSLNRLSTSTVSEAIDVDAVTTTNAPTSMKAEKRKIGALSDDEVEIVEGPVPAKKPKMKSSKIRGKKR